MPRRRGERVVKIWERFAFERLAHDALELADHVVVFRRDESKRVTGALGASRPPDAMDVSIGGIGHIIVDDV
jgi:hypothetical protein